MLRFSCPGLYLNGGALPSRGSGCVLHVFMSQSSLGFGRCDVAVFEREAVEDGDQHRGKQGGHPVYLVTGIKKIDTFNYVNTSLDSISRVINTEQ